MLEGCVRMLISPRLFLRAADSVCDGLYTVPRSKVHSEQHAIQSRASGARSNVTARSSKLDASRRELAFLFAGTVAAASSPLAALAKTPSKVFVAGATGQTGHKVVAALRAQGISVVAGVRDEAKAEKAGYTRDSGITVRVADVTKPAAELAQAMQGCDAVICATGGGATSPFDKRAKKVDNEGTKHLVDAAAQAGVPSFVLVSSLLTNAKALGEGGNPNYLILQVFGGILEEKLQAEKYLRASKLDWTIVRPGGLSAEAPEKVGNLVVGKEDSFLAKDGDPGREIARQTVAEVCVQALLQAGAKNKVVEVVASPTAAKQPTEQWFAGL